jgi:hypothetical protein
MELDIRNGDKVHMLFAVRDGKIFSEADRDWSTQSNKALQLTAR